MKMRIEGATPEELILIIFDGAIQNINLGIQFQNQRNYEESCYYFIKSQKFIVELRDSLNRDIKEVSDGLYRLYEYCIKKLREANIKKSNEPAQEVLVYFQELRKTWAEMIEKLKSENDPRIQIAK